MRFSTLSGKYKRAMGLVLATLATCTWAQITPNGATATTVQADANGRPLVGLAPVDKDRTSYNAFDAFNVDSRGVGLDNREVAARTIVSEVTSTKPSTIAGEVEVLGARAHLVIANPNGVTIDGGRFVNVGGLALGTGPIRFTEQQSAIGRIQQQPTMAIQDGVLHIGRDGLAGTLTQLHLLAGKVTVDGAVDIGGNNDFVPVAITAGPSVTQTDPSLPAASTARPWAITVTESETAPAGAQNAPVITAIDISSRGALSAGQIRLLVSQAGAGVRYAGDGFARFDEFSVSTSGDVEFDTASVIAARGIRVSADNISVSSSRSEQARLSSIAGPVSLQAEGSIVNRGGQIDAALNVPINAASAEAEQVALQLQAGGDIHNETLSASARGILFARDGQLSLKAEGDVRNVAGRIIGNSNVQIEAGGEFSNSVPLPTINGVVNQNPTLEVETSFSERLWYTLWLKRKKQRDVRINFGQRKLAGEMAFVVANGDIAISAQQVSNVGGEMNANAGNIEMTANQIKNQAVISGQLEFRESCNVFCERDGFSTVVVEGGGLNAADSIKLNAAESVTNIGGNLNALDSIEVNSPKVTSQPVTTYQVVLRPAGLGGLFSTQNGKVLRQNQGGALVANRGHIRFSDDADVQITGPAPVAGSGILGNASIQQEPLEPESPALGEDIGLLQDLF